MWEEIINNYGVEGQKADGAEEGHSTRVLRGSGRGRDF